VDRPRGVPRASSCTHAAPSRDISAPPDAPWHPTECRGPHRVGHAQLPKGLDAAGNAVRCCRISVSPRAREWRSKTAAERIRNAELGEKRSPTRSADASTSSSPGAPARDRMHAAHTRQCDSASPQRLWHTRPACTASSPDSYALLKPLHVIPRTAIARRTLSRHPRPDAPWHPTDASRPSACASCTIAERTRETCRFD
jgi:hypothetical protein